MMKDKEKTIFIIVGGVLLIVLLIMTAGAIDEVNRGNGFLFIPSFSPTATNTNTPTFTMTPSLTNTPTFTATNTMTFTPTLVPTFTPTISPTVTNTLTPSATYTLFPTATATTIPTLDGTALAEKIYEEVTAVIKAYNLSQTPSATPVIPDNELYTGLRMINEKDHMELFFVESGGDQPVKGFWMDWSEVSNEKYEECVQEGSCSNPASDLCEGKRYYQNIKYRDFPVVNITREQASLYCSWAGMQLMTLDDWKNASKSVPDEYRNIDRISEGPISTDSENSDIIGNVWEWTADMDGHGNGIIAGGSWKTTVQDVRNNRIAVMPYHGYSDDIGFRCISYVLLMDESD